MYCGCEMVVVVLTEIVGGLDRRFDFGDVGGFELVGVALSKGETCESKLNFVLRVDLVESGQCFWDFGVSHCPVGFCSVFTGGGLDCRVGGRDC